MLSSFAQKLVSPILSTSSLFVRGFSTPAAKNALNPSNFGFVFDIDGVLLHGTEASSVAKRALKEIFYPEKSEANPEGLRTTPLVFLTNGGGHLESKRAEKLSEQLQVPIDENMIIQCHTPLRALAPLYFDKNVLVAGRGNPKEVLLEYGFGHVLTTDEVLATHPEAYPFKQNGIENYRRFAENTKVAAAIVVSDPSDWGSDAQILIDVLSGDGNLDTHSEIDSQQIPLITTNSDMFWANEHPLKRFGQGAFNQSLKLGAYARMLFKETTGRDLKALEFGKPSKLAYSYTINCLQRQWFDLRDILNPGTQWEESDFEEVPLKLSNIFGVGDNPRSDIKGANANGLTSILVKTGVFKGSDNDTVDPADVVVETVLDAVRHVMQLEI